MKKSKKVTLSDDFFPPTASERDFDPRMATWMREEAIKDHEMMRSTAHDFLDVFPPDADELAFNKRIALWMKKEMLEEEKMMQSLARDLPDVDLSSIPEFDDLDLTSLNDDFDRKMN